MKEDRVNFFMKGTGVSPGVAIGKAWLLHRTRFEIGSHRRLENEQQIEDEVTRFCQALDESKKQLLKVKEEMGKKGRKEASYIIDAHLLILEDKVIRNNTVEAIRKKKVDAPWALQDTIEELKRGFDDVEDEYLRERKSDIDYIGQRVFRNLRGKQTEELVHPQGKAILVAHDLSPADTASLDVNRVVGFVTDAGGKTSHTAIMARALEIPSVVGLERITQEVGSGDTVIVDGIIGGVLINPDAETLMAYQEKQRKYEDLEQELFIYRDLPAETSDGFRIKILANMELVEELPSIRDHGAEGVGLYRTEYLFLNRRDLPTEEDHFHTYKKVVEGVAPHPVTIRTLDLGGDKFISQFEIAEEMNPVMGLRAIRLCLKETRIFKTQLRAIFKASAFGSVRIMFPMISGMEEVQQIKRILEEVKKELDRENEPYDPNLEIGIMIEIPSAGTLADHFAKEVDFFSIGTNDLIQYSLAIDRVNQHVSYLYQPLHPAVLRLIRDVIHAAHDSGCRVAMCGEMAGEALYLPILVGMELDELSMNALSMLRVKRLLRQLDSRKCRNMVKEMLKFSTASEINRFVREYMVKEFSDELRRVLDKELNSQYE
jgi:phosphotransferase system enzyme I (PtsI)